MVGRWVGRSASRVAGWSAGALLAALIVVLTVLAPAAAQESSPTAVREDPPPSVLLTTLDLAQKRLAEAGYVDNVTVSPSPVPVQEDRALVVDQDVRRDERYGFVVGITLGVEAAVPDVTGLDVDEARRRLEEVTLSADVRGGTGDPSETVSEQAPTGGMPARFGSSVKIIIAPPSVESPPPNGEPARPVEPVPVPEPEPEPEPYPEPAPEPEPAPVPEPGLPEPAPAPQQEVDEPVRPLAQRSWPWAVAGLTLAIVSVVGGGTAARAARRRRERRWVHEHVHARARPGPVEQTLRSDQASAPTHTVRLVPHAGSAQERIEEVREP